MADLTLGCHEVHIITPPKPVFKVKKPETGLTVVVPVVGPPGPPGDIENLSWNLIQDKPVVFPPAPHTHPKSDVNGLVNSLNSLETAIETTDDMMDLTTIFENSIA